MSDLTIGLCCADLKKPEEKFPVLKLLGLNKCGLKDPQRKKFTGGLVLAGLDNVDIKLCQRSLFLGHHWAAPLLTEPRK